MDKSTKSFTLEETGAMGVFGLFLFVAILGVGGLALDIAYAHKSRTEIQVAADAAAHAAIYTRELGSLEDARAVAIETARRTLPPAAFGDVLEAEDIQFGTWDAENERFQVDNTLRDAVMVNTARFTSRGNAVNSMLLSFVGFDAFDIQTGAVYETYQPTCLREGLVAEGVVDVQSNNSYFNGFCIHSNTHVKFSTNNVFENNTIVSMPNLDELDLPNSGFETNDGLQDALRQKRYNIRILSRLDDIITSLSAVQTDYLPDYVNSLNVITLPGKNVDETDFVPGRVHNYTCVSGGQTLQIAAGSTLRDVVLTTNCKIKFGSNVTLDNTIIATTSTSSSSVTAASGLQVGRDDACAADGGSQILTRGGFDAPAALRMYGGQIIAHGDISFAANANGIEGASMVAGGKISGTSNMTMGFCGSGTERNFEAQYFHLRG